MRNKNKTAKAPSFTKTNNSDWNQVVADSDRNMFFAITNASLRSGASSSPSLNSNNLMA